MGMPGAVTGYTTRVRRRGRTVVCTAVAAVFTVGAQGCAFPPSTAPQALPPGTASVSIDGADTGERHFVTCDKLQWLLTIESSGADGGFTAMVDMSDDLDAKFVKIRQLGGFTGSAWDGGVGGLDVRGDDGMITITGTGYGRLTGAPPGPVMAPFTITTFC